MWTNGVLSQLVKFDIKGRMLGWIKGFLSERKIQIGGARLIRNQGFGQWFTTGQCIKSNLIQNTNEYLI